MPGRDAAAGGHAFGNVSVMPDTPLADPITTLEAKMTEMLDERFAQILRDMDRRSVDAMRQIDRRFVDVLMEMREGIATILQRLS